MPGTYISPAETGLYYLQSRYYSPKIGRFINADNYVTTGQGLLGNNMFAYCLNNPTNYVDNSGTYADALKTWVETMWWLCGSDTALPFGDLIYTFGIILLGAHALSVMNEDPTPQEDESENGEPEKPDVTYPGDDPTEAPEGTTWRGKGEQGSQEGNYYNPETGESWHPDLNHPDPIGPHWDFKDSNGIWWRVFIDDSGNTIIVLKP